MKTLLIFFMINFDGTFTFTKYDEFESKAACEKEVHKFYNDQSDEFEKSWAKCLTKNEIAGELNAF